MICIVYSVNNKKSIEKVGGSWHCHLDHLFSGHSIIITGLTAYIAAIDVGDQPLDTSDSREHRQG